MIKKPTRAGVAVALVAAVVRAANHATDDGADDDHDGDDDHRDAAAHAVPRQLCRLLLTAFLELPLLFAREGDSAGAVALCGRERVMF